MSSGRRERILITCSTFEVAKIVEPAKFYDVTKVHIIHYGDSGVYKDFFDEVYNSLHEWKPDMVIEDYDDKEIWKFTPMMETILGIIGKEMDTIDEKPEILVNISSGTHEFTAAAVLASMMWDNILAFTVPTQDYMVRDDMIKEIYYDKKTGKPVGLARSTRDPVKLSTYKISKPDRKLVLGLGVLKNKLKDNKRAPAPEMIRTLDKMHLIEAKYKYADKPDQKTIMSYQRNFIDKWEEQGWIERISKRDLKVTAEGDQILETFLSCYQSQKH